jgi:MoaA/NifB/PqqE/SkfB family radical SAM enzyme
LADLSELAPEPLVDSRLGELIERQTDSGPIFAIGTERGEPTLYRHIETLIEEASNRGFEQIEIFSNLTSLSDHLIGVFKRCEVAVATSVCSNSATVHDNITTVAGSFARTISNVKRLVAAGIKVRASFIEMKENRNHLVATSDYLNTIGVSEVVFDRLRKIGRGTTSAEVNLSELCGQCAGNKLCIAPDGAVSPCIMSKAWSVGSVLATPLSDLVRSNALSDLRTKIALETGSQIFAACNPDRPYPCNPDYGGACGPCNPNSHCGPNSCQPQRR